MALAFDTLAQVKRANAGLAAAAEFMRFLAVAVALTFVVDRPGELAANAFRQPNP